MQTKTVRVHERSFLYRKDLSRLKISDVIYFCLLFYSSLQRLIRATADRKKDYISAENLRKFEMNLKNFLEKTWKYVFQSLIGNFLKIP